MILVFFVLQAILWTTAISLTAGDKSHTVVAGYDEQALNWDEVKALKVRSDQLGWKADLRLGSNSDIRGDRDLTLALTTREGAPLDNAQIVVTAYHRGRAADKQAIQMQPSGTDPGIYTGKVKVQHSGKWQFSGFAKIGDDQFLIEYRTVLKSNRSL